MKLLKVRTAMVKTLALLAVVVAVCALASPDSAVAQQRTLTVTPDDTRVTLSWPAVSDKDVYAYEIGWRRNVLTRYWHKYETRALELVLPNLINGVEYEFDVIPINGDGDYINAKKNRITATATPNGPVLPPPVITAVPGEEPGSVDLSWDNALLALSFARTFIYQYKVSDAEWHVEEAGDVPGPLTSSLKIKVAGDVKTATIEDLAPGTQYTFRIHAISQTSRNYYIRSWKSDWAEVTAWSKTVKPEINSVAIGNEQVELKWNAVPGATGYAYQYRAGQSGKWSTKTNVAAEPRSATITGLANNTEYAFRVRSTGHGASEWSDPVYATPARPTEYPSAPAQVDVNPGSTAAVFTWQSGGNGTLGTCPDTRYLLSIIHNGTPVPGSLYDVVAVSDPSHVYRLYVNQGLQPNESYTALISSYGQACNAVGAPVSLDFNMNGETEPLRVEKIEGSEEMLPPFRVKNIDVRTVGFKAILTWSRPKANADGRCPLEDNVEYRWHLQNVQTGDVAEGSFESDADTVELALDKMKKGYEYRLMVMSYSPRCGEANGESKPKNFKWLQPESKGKRFAATESN